MFICESILPLRSHPDRIVECFSSPKASPRRAAKLVAENEKICNNNKMLVGLFEFDFEVDQWKHTGDVFEHVLYVATRDDNTLYALDAADQLKLIAKVDLPFRPKSYTLALNRTNAALYITSTYPWIVSVYDARTLQLLGPRLVAATAWTAGY
ncbi:hypothetical protein BGX28_000438 [Mortierella sp. GBA30]|nr:hypothetical protein BGX28_000438 [Mortierella sp. GBA30]